MERKDGYQTIDISKETTSTSDGRSWRPKLLAVALAVVIIVINVTLIVVLMPESSSESQPVESTCVNPSVQGSNGMVSTTNSLATMAGLEILKQGGNAVDAFAAIQFMLTLVQPHSTGIGGGLFVMLYNSTNQQVYALDGREEAPNRFNATSFCQNATCQYDADCGCDTGAWPFSNRSTGGHPVGVPGTVHAVGRLLAEHGTMSLAQVLAPAIRTAREGFPMNEYLNSQITQSASRLSIFPATAAIYLPEGKPPAVGQIFKNPDLADTYELLAKEGPDLFYTGQIADEIVATVKSAVNPWTNLAGVMEKSDLEAYKSVYRQPVSFTHQAYNSSQYTLYTMPMPAGAATMGLMLNMIEPLAISSLQRNGVDFIHRFLDIQDIAFADRNQYMGDADFVDVPLDGLLDKDYARSRATTFLDLFNSSASRYGGSVPEGSPPGSSLDNFANGQTTPEHGTTHFSVVDKHGNVISCTTTIEDNFGSAVVVPGRGFLLNNELTDFQPLPVDPDTGLPYANGPAGGKKPRRTALGADSTTLGGKRPLSSMTPTIIFKDGKPIYAVGSPGGARIIASVTNTVVNLLDYNMCLSDAVVTYRVYSRNTPGTTELETQLYDQQPLVDALTARGFQLAPRAYVGYIEGIKIHYSEDGHPSSFEGVADTTRLSTALAAGY